MALLRDPAGLVPRPLQALDDAVGGDPELVGRLAVRLEDVLETQLDRVHAELLGGLVDDGLDGVARVDRAVSAHRTAGGLVRVDTATRVAEVRDLVRALTEHAVVVGRDHAERRERAAVDDRLGVEAEDLAVLVECDLHIDGPRMAAAIRQEDLLAVECQAHGALHLSREQTRRHLVRKRVALAAETAAHGRAEDPHHVHRHVHDLGERPVDIVRYLRRRVERQTPIGLRHGSHRVRLGERVRDTDELEEPARRDGGVRERLVHVAEVLLHAFLRVRAVHRPGVDGLLDGIQALVGREVLGQLLVDDLDHLYGLRSRRLVVGGDGGDTIADVAHLVGGEGLLVLADRQHAELGRRIGAGHHSTHTRQRLGPRGIDPEDLGMRKRRAQKPGEERVRKADVVAVDGLAGDLLPAIDQRLPAADDREFLRHPSLQAVTLRRARPHSGPCRAARPPRSRPHRRSSRNRCSGRGCRRSRP